MSEDEKLKERISLLMRVYWTDDVFKIGNELKLPFFNQFSSWYDMNHYQGALEIAKSIDDKKLLDILSSHPKPYGISLGGFQGRFYSMDENGRLTFESSEESIRKNIQSALNKKKEQAYGVLQAIINKNGRANYFDLVHEIDNVLGYEFAPSFILPRLGPMKLVFKTGSRQYPDWTMPSEIIPIVQDELGKFKLSIHSLITKKSSGKNIVENDNGTQITQTKWDVFISHASEDKKIATPFAEKLREMGLNVWYDQNVLRWGDSLMDSINKGLKDSIFGIVVLSKTFFKKKWTQTELKALVSLAHMTEDKKILPLLYEISHEEMVEQYPILADIVARSWDDGLETLADEVKAMIMERKRK